MAEYEDIDQSMKVSAQPLTDWKNEPTCVDLKQDYQEASGHHDAHVSQVNVWLDNLNVTGSAKIKRLRAVQTLSLNLSGNKPNGVMQLFQNPSSVMKTSLTAIP